MELIRIAILAFVSLIVLFLLAKMMGDRQMSELSMFDYINSITIGSIAAEMATSLENYKKPLVAMIVYGVISSFISYITCKSMILRRFFEGRALLLYQNGQIYEKNLLKAKVDIDEFLAMCRIAGYFDLSDVHTAILEPNGKVSIIPTAKNRPVTAEDLNLNPIQCNIQPNVIIDGHILKDNLKATGKDEQWLNKQIKSYGVKDIKEIILATCDCSNNKLNIYVKLHKKMTSDLFE